MDQDSKRIRLLDGVAHFKSSQHDCFSQKNLPAQLSFSHNFSQ